MFRVRIIERIIAYPCAEIRPGKLANMIIHRKTTMLLPTAGNQSRRVQKKQRGLVFSFLHARFQSVMLILDDESRQRNVRLASATEKSDQLRGIPRKIIPIKHQR